MTKISDVYAVEDFDSRGNPTVRVWIKLENGILANAYAASGASKGLREAHELRDGDEARFFGKGVQKAVNNVVTVIREKLVGMDVESQEAIDEMLISGAGPNKKDWGANATTAVSLACAKAAAQAQNKPLFIYINELYEQISGNKVPFNIMPVPMLNMLNGGEHGPEGATDFQEFMIVPFGAKSFKHAMQIASEFQALLKKNIAAEYGPQYTTLGDEGGFSPPCNTDAALQLLHYTINQPYLNEGGKNYGQLVGFALDCAANHYFKSESGLYVFDGKSLDSIKYASYLSSLLTQYPLISIEDGNAELDKSGWSINYAMNGEKVQLVGDDLFVTNKEILAKSEGEANSILIKVNQIGTLTETCETIALAKSKGYTTVISHRSGETTDDSIADIGVATNSQSIKTGAFRRGERIAKFSRFLAIDEVFLKIFMKINSEYMGNNCTKFNPSSQIKQYKATGNLKNLPQLKVA